MYDDRVIDDFAQRLVPEAFAHRHTAYDVNVVDTPASGSAAFDHWVEERIQEAAAQRYAWGGRPIRYVIIEAGDGTRWRWDGEQCCPPEWLADRVREESHQLPEPWLFAVELGWPDPVWEFYDEDLGELVGLTEPVVPGSNWPATWYAEARGRGVATTRAGQVDIDRDGRIVGRRELPPREGLAGAFHRVLRGHPDRKRHPLRRS